MCQNRSIKKWVFPFGFPLNKSQKGFPQKSTHLYLSFGTVPLDEAGPLVRGAKPNGLGHRKRQQPPAGQGGAAEHHAPIRHQHLAGEGGGQRAGGVVSGGGSVSEQHPKRYVAIKGWLLKQLWLKRIGKESTTLHTSATQQGIVSFQTFPNNSFHHVTMWA